MRYIIDQEGQKLTGVIISSAWLALKTRNFYSLSVLWGVLGPKVFFAKVPNTPGYTTDFSSVLCSSPSLIPSTDGILIGKSRHALTRSCCSTILLFYGPAVLRGSHFPTNQSANLLTSMLFNLTFMGMCIDGILFGGASINTCSLSVLIAVRS